MLKQESNKMFVMNSKNNYNKTSVFLVKALFKENFDLLKKCGFVNGFIKMDGLEILQGPGRRLLLLLFKHNKLKITDIKNIIHQNTHVNVLFADELVNDYLVIAVEFPPEFNKDYDMFIEGKYSKFSKEFKSLFPKTKDAFNSKNVKVGKKYTLYYHIFHKTEWLKNFWKTKFELIELDDKLELWEKPNEEDTILKTENLIK